MFNCSICSTPTGPSIPVTKRVDATRPVEYTRSFTGPDGTVGVERIGFGEEIDLEVSLCPDCADVKITPKPNPNVSATIKGLAEVVFTTASKVKDNEGKATQKGIKFMASLPLGHLSQVLEDTMAPKLRISLVAVAIENMMSRTLDHTRRGVADVKEVLRVVKPYEKRGGGL